MTNHKTLTLEEEQTLFKKYSETKDTETQFEIIQNNLDLVRAIARKYLVEGIEFDDLVSEGSIGLIKAIDKFDYTKGYKFSTYAHWWIRQAILNYITNHSRTIRLTADAYQKISKIRRFKDEFKEQYDITPNNAEIAESVGLTEADVKLYQSVSNRVISLHIPINEDEDLELGDIIPDNNCSLEEAFENKERDLVVLKAVNTLLAPKERIVIKHHYGLNETETMTFTEIGQYLGLTSERVRQIELKAIRKLRIGLINWGYGPSLAA